MTTVSVIGLGIMGSPMAANLAKAGFDVVGHNRSPDKVQKLVDAGGRAAKDVPAAREAGVVIPLGAAVSQLVAAMVARGDGGLDHSGLLRLVQELSGREA